MSFGIDDAEQLWSHYDAAYPLDEGGSRAKTLYQYLSIDSNLKHHSTIRYASLEKRLEAGVAAVHPTSLDPDVGRQLLDNLIRVEFVDAQRNINDDDSSRSNRLSAAFASYYKKNLEQPEYAAEAHKVIDDNNAELTKHYEVQFEPLISMIKGLGVPPVNDRGLRIISSLSPESALQGNTELLYVDERRGHELPELYNGLGFKNLIYMAIQARHFHSQWVRTSKNRPLCLLIFIEEPEVHLHAQVQQTFIANIWSVIQQSAKVSDAPELVPQIVATTHSSHILDAVDFEKVRYFRRRAAGGDAGINGVRNASEVRNLRGFVPQADVVGGVASSPNDSLAFLKRYLRLTHCDLFFSDAAILVEGAVEKLLMPSMIESSAPRLGSTYLTTLEVGGAYAHRFESLLAFLGIPYLVITDLDSVNPKDNRSSCRADSTGAVTSNESIKKLCGKHTVSELMAMTASDKVDEAKDRCVAFEFDVIVTENGISQIMRPRTIEEAIAYENFQLLRTGEMSIGVQIPESLPDAYEVVYNRVRSDGFKKTDFAMSLLASVNPWVVPAYIAQGLSWLEVRLCGPAQSVDNPAASTGLEGNPP